MKNLKMRLAVLLLSTFCLLAGVYAQITPSSDASTSSLAPTQNYGSNGYLYVHSTTQLTYIQFDLSTIPSGYTGANIAKASLKVYLYSVAGGGTFNVDYVTSPWTEKTITFNDSPTLGGFIAASGKSGSSRLCHSMTRPSDRVDSKATPKWASFPWTGKPLRRPP